MAAFNYKSPEWRAVRKERGQMTHWNCECCPNSWRNGVMVEVHHILDPNEFPGLALDVTMCRVLCTKCHDCLHWLAGRHDLIRLAQMFGEPALIYAQDEEYTPVQLVFCDGDAANDSNITLDRIAVPDD